MKVRVSIPGAYMAMDMEEEKAHRTFRKIMELLCIAGARNEKEVASGKELDGALTAIQIPEPMEPETDVPAQIGSEEPAAPMISIGYGGFLYIKCSSCGKVKGFCAKTRLSNFRCDCGSLTRLEHLVPLFMRCECGRNSKYLTNMEEPAFDINCYDCGNPVAVAWNPGKKQYETIR